MSADEILSGYAEVILDQIRELGQAGDEVRGQGLSMERGKTLLYRAEQIAANLRTYLTKLDRATHQPAGHDQTRPVEPDPIPPMPDKPAGIETGVRPWKPWKA